MSLTHQIRLTSFHSIEFFRVKYTLIFIIATLLLACSGCSPHRERSTELMNDHTSRDIHTSVAGDFSNTDVIVEPDLGIVDLGAVDLSLSDMSPLDESLSDAMTSSPSRDMLTDAMIPELDQEVISRSPRSLVIILDGVRPDVLAHAETPHLDAMIEGNWRDGYRGAYTPFAQNLYDASTVSGPNHASIMTGANGRQHGVSSNGDVGRGRYEDFPHYLARIESNQPDLATAYLFTWGTDINIPSGADYVKDGDDESNVARVIAILNETHIDDSGDQGTSWRLGADPHAIFLFLDDPDHAGHAQGFELDVAFYVDELASVDGQIGSILDALVNRPTWPREDWQIIITSDHGGYHTSHGGSSAPEHTIPFLIVSRSVTQGQLPPSTRNLDVAPTALDHLGVSIPPELLGESRARGSRSSVPVNLAHELVGYYRFEGDLLDATGRGHHGVIGAQSSVDPLIPMTGGKFGGYLSISTSDAADNGSSYVTLGRPADYDFRSDDAFSVTLWFRSHGEQRGDPVIIGNKDWVSGANPGWLILANEGADNSFGANYAGTGRRLDLEDIDYTDTDWWFLAATFDPAGLAILFCGDRTGQLRWMALDAHDVGDLISSLPLNIGQDGTGAYRNNLNGDVDDLGIWRRALNLPEVHTLYQRGRGQEVMTLLAHP